MVVARHDVSKFLEHHRILGSMIYQNNHTGFVSSKPKYVATGLLVQEIATHPATSLHIIESRSDPGSARDLAIISVMGKQGICWMIWPGHNRIYGFPANRYEDFLSIIHYYQQQRYVLDEFLLDDFWTLENREQPSSAPLLPMISTCFEVKTSTRNPYPDDIVTVLLSLMNDDHVELGRLVSLPYPFSKERSWKEYCLSDELSSYWELHGFDSCDHCNETIENWDEAWLGKEDGIFKVYCKQCNDILLGNTNPSELEKQFASELEKQFAELRRRSLTYIPTNHRCRHD